MQKKGLAVIILAAGKGTRMKSSLAKVLHPLAGHPLLHYVLDTVEPLNPDRRIAVVGHQSEKVQELFGGRGIEFVDQKELLGTGHAALQAAGALAEFQGEVLILCGDMPFIKARTLKALLSKHRESGAACSLLVLRSREPRDFGLILRDAGGAVNKIVEQRDATEDEKKVDEFNAGVYCFDNNLFLKALRSLRSNNAQKEYYLTDTIQYMVQNGYDVVSVETEDASEIFGINSQEDLKRAEDLLLGENLSA